MHITSRAPVRIDFGGAWTDVNLFAHSVGGVVVNATIDKYVTGSLRVLGTGEGAEAQEGMNVSYGFDLPSGSGLGTSSALNVVWLSLIKNKITGNEDRAQIAELAYQLEEMLGILGGKQDQYAAALGGINLLRFARSGVTVEPIGVSQETVSELEARSVLCYTGKPRLSGGIHENVWGAFQAGKTETVQALYALRDIAERMPGCLSAGDVEGFAALLGENWQQQKRLDDSVTNAQMETLFAVAEAAGAKSGKACGAGGGGCLYFIAQEGKREAVVAALRGQNARVIDFRFTFEGLTVTQESLSQG